MDPQTPFEIELARELSAASQARRWLEARYATALGGDELDTAQLLASELVNNAVLHGCGTITLRTALDENRLMVEVIDEGSGFERVLDQHDFDKIGGFGLEIVEAASSRWGVHEGTTHVWFELERPGPRVGAESKPELENEPGPVHRLGRGGSGSR
jgi:anti-sigma regulatory factor (Ser/Thr protein kinase)